MDYDSLWTNCRRTLEDPGSCCPQRPTYGPKVLEDGDSGAQTTVCEISNKNWHFKLDK